MWSWEVIDGGLAASTGSVGEVFGNESRRPPGFLAANAPSTDATLFAREVIQNSWDAARELQEADKERRVPPFHIRFAFRAARGRAKSDLARHLALAELRERVVAVGRDPLRLAPTDVLDCLDDDVPMRFLVVSEEATTGMYGPFGPKSKLFLAMLTSGFTPKGEGAGGSYGYGKAGLVLGSAIRSVVAYTCFQDRPDDPGVTRRLFGVTYWPPHTIESQSFNGFARLGTRKEGLAFTVPFENEDADQMAEALGLAVRSPDNLHDLGSSFLLADPTVEPVDLRVAIERYWWPARLEELFTVEIEDYDRNVLVPSPRTNPDLRAFVAAYDLLQTQKTQDADGNLELRRYRFNAMKIDDARYELGETALAAEPNGWSFPKVDEPSEDAPPDDADANGAQPVEQRSLVALVRGPRMVVEYSQRGSTPPYVRGVFVADDAIDDFLRQTEPKAHDRWQTEPSHARASHPHATRIAASLRNRISRAVNDFRHEIAPPRVSPEGAKLELFDNLMNRLLHGKTPPRPPTGLARSVSIQFPLEQIVPVGDGTCRLRAGVRLALSDHVPDDAAEVEVRIQYLFSSDSAGRSQDDFVTLSLRVPEPLQRIDDRAGTYVLRGQLRHAPSTIQLESEPYSADWSGELHVSAEVVIPKGEAGIGD